MQQHVFRSGSINARGLLFNRHAPKKREALSVRPLQVPPARPRGARDQSLRPRDGASLRRSAFREARLFHMPIARLDARQNFSDETLPVGLARIRLSRGTPLGAARFLPESEEEALLGIFASWNMLDAQMYAMTRMRRNDSEMAELRSRQGKALPANHGHEHVERKHLWQTGYLRELQLRRMVQLIRRPGVQRYCEVGMNGGHSATAMLYARLSPRARQPIAKLLVREVV